MQSGKKVKVKGGARTIKRTEEKAEFIFRFAQEKDEEELDLLFQEYGMGLAGKAEDHLILRAGNQIVAGSKIVETGPNHFFLEVLGVRADQLHRGWGKILLKSILENPWKCSRLSMPAKETGYRIETLAKGQAADFYYRYGFRPCEFAAIPEPYREQCGECPERRECKPVPMIFFGGKDDEKSDCRIYQST